MGRCEPLLLAGSRTHSLTVPTAAAKMAAPEMAAAEMAAPEMAAAEAAKVSSAEAAEVSPAEAAKVRSHTPSGAATKVTTGHMESPMV
jgi:hypothetical protein